MAADVVDDAGLDYTVELLKNQQRARGVPKVTTPELLTLADEVTQAELALAKFDLQVASDRQGRLMRVVEARRRLIAAQTK